MAAEKFIMVSLEDNKSKDIANVISNETSRKILNFLGDKDAAESDIAKELKIPASTVNYNVQNLLKNGLIEVKDFYWSEKGNKVNIYTVAKKLIIIAPKGTSVNDVLKKSIPVLAFSLIAAGMVYLFSKGKMLFWNSRIAGESLMAKGAEATQYGGALMDNSAQASIPAAEKAMLMAAPAADEAVNQTVQQAVPEVVCSVPDIICTPPSEPNYALWFLIGALFATAAFIAVYLIKHRKN